MDADGLTAKIWCKVTEINWRKQQPNFCIAQTQHPVTKKGYAETGIVIACRFLSPISALNPSTGFHSSYPSY
ncbi:MAG: hypothetical protein LBG17_03475 [Bacteroidales bacterium]|jgi:hypothetical protein|nr:hypothetical protein [Bacteroidales bacterium]